MDCMYLITSTKTKIVRMHGLIKNGDVKTLINPITGETQQYCKQHYNSMVEKFLRFNKTCAGVEQYGQWLVLTGTKLLVDTNGTCIGRLIIDDKGMETPTNVLSNDDIKLLGDKAIHIRDATGKVICKAIRDDYHCHVLGEEEEENLKLSESVDINQEASFEEEEEEEVQNAGEGGVHTSPNIV
jgi:hypothetical protein